MSAEEMPSEPTIVEYRKDHGPVFIPLPLPPRPSTAIGEFSPRFQEHWFDGKSFLFGVLVTSLFFAGLALIVT